MTAPSTPRLLDPMNEAKQQFRRGVCVVAAMIASLPWYAFAQVSDTITRPFQNLLTWLCGPVALILAGVSMFAALVSLIFMGGIYLGRLAITFFGCVALLGLGKIISFMTSAAN